jgi:large subunit ribosomal protein L1
MGKVRTRTLGLEDEEQKQKDEQKQKAQEKKAKKGAAKEAVVETSSNDEKDERVESAPKDADVEKKPKAKKTAKTVKTTAAKRGKKHVAALKLVDPKKVYSVSEAVSTLKKIKYAKFDESVEVHLNVDVTGLKGEADLPHSTGKTVRVAVVDDALLEQLEKGTINFDMLVTHPSYMPKLAKFAKLLGPRGMMPNPKAGTISPNPEQLVEKFSKGTLRWKSEPKFPMVHQMIGKISSDEKSLEQNVTVFLKSVGKVHISSAYLKTTMSPSLRLNIEQI